MKSIFIILYLCSSSGLAANLDDLSLPPLRGQVALPGQGQVNDAWLDETNYLTILGLAPGATVAEIKARYRALVKLYHPDSNGRLQPYVEKYRTYFLKVQRAYDVLSDPAMRARYEASLRAGTEKHFDSRARGEDKPDFSAIPFSHVADKRDSYQDTFSRVREVMAHDTDLYRFAEVSRTYDDRLLWTTLKNPLCLMLTAAGMVVACGNSEYRVTVPALAATGIAAFYANLRLQHARISRLRDRKLNDYFNSVTYDEENLIGVKRDIIAFDMLEDFIRDLQISNPLPGEDYFSRLKKISKVLNGIPRGWMFRYLNGNPAHAPLWEKQFSRDLEKSKFRWRKVADRLVRELNQHGLLTPRVLERARTIFGDDFARDVNCNLLLQD